MRNNRFVELISPLYILAVVILTSLSGSTTAQDKQASDPRKEIEASQRQLAGQFSKVEELFIRMGELEAASNPTRAALLMQAAQLSKQLATQQRMLTASEYLSKGQLSRAIQEQDASKENLRKLLELLQSENRSSRVRDERKRLEEVLKDIRRIENIQRATRGRVESGEDKEQAANDQSDLEKQLGQASSELKTDAENKKNSDGGKDATETSTEKPTTEKPREGQPKTDDPSKKTPDPDDKNKENNNEKKSGENGDSERDDPDKKSDKNSDSEKSKSSDPSKESEASEDQGKSSDQESPKPASKEEQAKKRVERARKNMKEAEERLRKDKRKEAIEAQNNAEQELQVAIAELERILMQLREEEIERALADLESRLKKMYEMEKTIRDQTERLSQLTGEARDRQLEIGANKLSLEQTKMLMEGQRALLLLHDEGSSQAFPEALEQVNRDAQSVSRRLATADVAAGTQAIQDEILGALEEMLDSLKQVQKQREEQKQQNSGQPQQQQGDSKDQPLVHKLAELKLIKTLQLRVNRRTDRVSQGANNAADLIGQLSDPQHLDELQELSMRQKKIQQVTREIILENTQK